MVVFTCNGCGHSLKKNQVDKHRMHECRNAFILSCMDCGKDFKGEEYKQHTTCISEDQKYGGKDYQPKSSSNKGLIKQEKWIEHIKNTIASKKLSGPLADLLENLINFNNIPRKQKKFENFIGNCFRIKNSNLIKQAWEIFNEGNNIKPETSTNNNTSNNENATTSNRASKRKADDDTNVSESTNKKFCPASNSIKNHDMTTNGFEWEKCIEQILITAPNNTIDFSKLKKQVLTQFTEMGLNSSQMSSKKFKSKLKSVLFNDPRFILCKDNKQVYK